MKIGHALGWGLIVSAWLLPLSSSAARWSHTNDSDISPRRPFLRGPVSLDLAPDSIQTGGTGAGLAIQVLRMDHGTLTPVTGLEFNIGSLGFRAFTDLRGIVRTPFASACAPGQTQTQAVAALANRYFSVTGEESRNPYRITATLPCAGEVRLLFKSDSNGGQALGIWQVASRAALKLQAEIGLDFWSSPLEFIWPASDGDYYSEGLVHITRGDAWDVVGHEMGHGIYDLGRLGQFGGGQHYIDKCYDATLALSEGWASFFSGWVSVDLNDPDAKFEFMVPRRAPIRFENIPADVCRGESNEWRVTGFFWDLVDLHDDGEQAHEPFAKVWRAMQGSEVSSTTEAAERMKSLGMDIRELQTVWQLNFQTPPPTL